MTTGYERRFYTDVEYLRRAAEKALGPLERIAGAVERIAAAQEPAQEPAQGDIHGDALRMVATAVGQYALHLEEENEHERAALVGEIEGALVDLERMGGSLRASP